MAKTHLDNLKLVAFLTTKVDFPIYTPYELDNDVSFLSTDSRDNSERLAEILSIGPISDVDPVMGHFRSKQELAIMVTQKYGEDRLLEDVIQKILF